MEISGTYDRNQGWVEENGLATNKKLAQVGGSGTLHPSTFLSLGARETGTSLQAQIRGS